MTFAFAMLVLALAGTAADPSFEAWKHRHRRTYATMAEEGHRRAVYQANQRLIAEHNARQSFVTLEMNAFGDLTHREWADGHLRLRRQQPSDGVPNRTASCAAALHGVPSGARQVAAGLCHMRSGSKGQPNGRGLHIHRDHQVLCGRRPRAPAASATSVASGAGGAASRDGGLAQP